MITVVIPAYNEEDHLPACLESLVQQNTQFPFQVVVVDNNSTDHTAKVAQAFSDRLNLTIVTELRKGRGAARRAGFAAAKTEIIFSTDADTVVPQNWIETFIQFLMPAEAVAVSGTCRINDCGAVTSTLFNWLQPVSMKVYRVLFGHYWLSGFSFAIKQEAYHKAGGFDAALNAQEDVDLAVRVAKIGRIVMIPQPAVLFSGRRFHDGLLYGVWQYLKTFVAYYFFKKKTITLTDPR